MASELWQCLTSSGFILSKQTHGFRLSLDCGSQRAAPAPAASAQPGAGWKWLGSSLQPKFPRTESGKLYFNKPSRYCLLKSETTALPCMKFWSLKQDRPQNRHLCVTSALCWNLCNLPLPSPYFLKHKKKKKLMKKTDFKKDQFFLE